MEPEARSTMVAVGEREWVKVARELASPGTKCAPLMACHSVGCEKSTHTQMDAHTRSNFGWLKLLGLCLTVERLVLDTANVSEHVEIRTGL